MSKDINEYLVSVGCCLVCRLIDTDRLVMHRRNNNEMVIVALFVQSVCCFVQLIFDVDSMLITYCAYCNRYLDILDRGKVLTV